MGILGNMIGGVLRTGGGAAIGGVAGGIAGAVQSNNIGDRYFGDIAKGALMGGAMGGLGLYGLGKLGQVAGALKKQIGQDIGNISAGSMKTRLLQEAVGFEKLGRGIIGEGREAVGSVASLVKNVKSDFSNIPSNLSFRDKMGVIGSSVKQNIASNPQLQKASSFIRNNQKPIGLAAFGIAGGVAMGAMSNISMKYMSRPSSTQPQYQGNMSEDFGFISPNNSGIYTGGGQSYLSSDFAQSTNGLVQGLHRSRH